MKQTTQTMTQAEERALRKARVAIDEALFAPGLTLENVTIAYTGPLARVVRGAIEEAYTRAGFDLAYRVTDEALGGAMYELRQRRN